MRRRGERREKRERDGRGWQRNLFSEESSHLLLEKKTCGVSRPITTTKERPDFYKLLKDKEFYIT